ncbi:hypothetical protein [Streptomyces sp. NPDC002851]
MAKRLIRTVIAVAFVAAAAVGIVESAEDAGARASTTVAASSDPGWRTASASDPGWIVATTTDPGWD